MFLTTGRQPNIHLLPRLLPDNHFVGAEVNCKGRDLPSGGDCESSTEPLESGGSPDGRDCPGDIVLAAHLHLGLDQLHRRDDGSLGGDIRYWST